MADTCLTIHPKLFISILLSSMDLNIDTPWTMLNKNKLWIKISIQLSDQLLIYFKRRLIFVGLWANQPVRCCQDKLVPLDMLAWEAPRCFSWLHNHRWPGLLLPREKMKQSCRCFRDIKCSCCWKQTSNISYWFLFDRIWHGYLFGSSLVISIKQILHTVENIYTISLWSLLNIK